MLLDSGLLPLMIAILCSAALRSSIAKTQFCSVDFAHLREQHPELIICSITGFGQTGAWATLPFHGLNMDALGDALNVEWRAGQPPRGWAFTSWGNELGAMAVCAALGSVRCGGAS